MDAKAPTLSSASAFQPDRTAYSILIAISVSHCLNDTIQSLIPAIYPMLRDNFALSYSQIGLITLAFQLTASLLQPVVGLYTDHRPQPYSLTIGMGFSLVGLIMLAFAPSYYLVLLAAMLVGTGSSVFHPESSRVARMASGGKTGLAQSVFQVGGNLGSSIGPLLAAFIVLPFGQHSIAAFSAVALLAMFILWNVGNWYAAYRRNIASGHKSRLATTVNTLSQTRVIVSLVILLALIFSKFFYMASMSSYYTFYLISKFGLSQQEAQVHLFVFLFAVAAGTLIGGPIGDRIGRKYVIWVSILGVLPFTLALPYANLTWTTVLAVIIGFILSSAFSAIIVFAQELVPGKTGMVAGLFFGFAFGMGGLGAAALGVLADWTSIEFVYKVCSFLPMIGLLTLFLPNIERPAPARA
ncbi:MFS transporter [Labrys monachus]|uniref:FSR family fosmidomycin resistance protein-like MFS transporter n=1 Tax=Labrys monachus TaxID=217067 RepID=A0ABU0FAW6_9HYPH|nr:MFS transporter [Labrys monachus]MDQ0391762.1 FSR family fosmidomycin resistance protein-like MFS transporter [Labrys monachus]